MLHSHLEPTGDGQRSGPPGSAKTGPVPHFAKNCQVGRTWGGDMTPTQHLQNMIQAEPGFSPSNLSSEGNMFLSPFKSRPELLIFYGFSLAASESKSTVQADCVLSGLWQIVLPPFTFWIPQIRFGWRATIPAAELLAHSVSLTPRSGGLSFCHSI